MQATSVTATTQQTPSWPQTFWQSALNLIKVSGAGSGEQVVPAGCSQWGPCPVPNLPPSVSLDGGQQPREQEAGSLLFFMQKARGEDLQGVQTGTWACGRGCAWQEVEGKATCEMLRLLWLLCIFCYPQEKTKRSQFIKPWCGLLWQNDSIWGIPVWGLGWL